MTPWAICVLAALAAAEPITKTNTLGPVEVTTVLSPSEPTIGDEIKLEIRVKADPDVEVLMPEFGEALNRYTILDYVPRQKVADDGSNLFTQRYTLQPYLSGEQSIPPILVEFVDNRPGKKPAPDDYDAYEILTDRIDFNVKSVLPGGATQELKPPLGKLELEPKESSRVWVFSILWAVITFVSLIVGIIVWLTRRQHVVRRNAYEIARARLDKLLAGRYPQDEAEIEQFFVAISNIVRRYLEDRFDLRPPDLTTEEFLILAGSSSDLSKEHQGLLHEFLRQADLVKFAGVQATEDDMERSRDAAVRFLEETRANAPLIEVSGDPDGSEPSVKFQAASQKKEETNA